MEDNQVEDLGFGNFRKTAATDRYSKLDQYLMGFRDPDQIGPMFYVDNAFAARNANRTLEFLQEAIPLDKAVGWYRDCAKLIGFRTNLGINNPGASTASVSVSLFGADGTLLAGTTSPVSVAPQGLVQINNILRYLLTGSSIAPVTNQQGYLKLTSNSPIKGVCNLDRQLNERSQH